MRTRVMFGMTAAVVWWALVFSSPSIASTPAAEHFSLVLNTPASLGNVAQTAERNAYIVLQPWESARAKELKAANPSLSVLAYEDLSAIARNAGPGGLSSSGVSYGEANPTHPEWFLKEANGSRIAERNYAYLWMANIGNPGYQKAWTTNVLHVLESGPWDGVFMDETNPTASADVTPVSRIAAYPTDASYQRAVRSMLSYAGPQIIAAHQLAIPNIGAWSEYPEVAKEWLGFVSGGMDEHFVKWASARGVGYRTPRQWLSQIQEVESTESMGKRFLAVTQTEPGDAAAIRYGWASALLAADGHTAYSATDAYDGTTWSTDYEASLGAPVLSAEPTGEGAWRRVFEDGLVVVNPTESTLAVSLGGIYSGSGLTHACEATLAPHTSLILRSENVAGELPLRGQPTAESPLTPPPALVGGHASSPTVGDGADPAKPKVPSAASKHTKAALIRCRKIMRHRSTHSNAKLRAKCSSVLRAHRSTAHKTTR